MPRRENDSIAAIDRLAEQVACGDVVFFVGAGFSVDSEGNTAANLIRRLLLRLLALSQVCELEGVRDRLKNTFDLEAPSEGASPQKPFPYTKRDVERLAEHYYEVNDWFCAAFAEVLQFKLPSSDAELEEKARRISHVERGIAAAPGEGLERLTLELQSANRLEQLLPALTRWARACHPGAQDVFRQAGKALFLDTLGFREASIMRGRPAEAGASVVLESYEGRLLPRHHVIARLAREGLCGTTVTANYDLLLEGAFRVSGFGWTARGNGATGSNGASQVLVDDIVFTDRLPATTFADFARIADAVEFFFEAKALNTSAILKMHGSVDRYRACEYEPPDQLQSLGYLRSMVFTYREIQNWRGEDWVADFLRTVLRTRTVAFVGYSLQDPVIHDTFRTVYEEMAEEVRRSALAAPPWRPNEPKEPPKLAAAAPAYFFAPGTDKREFHGIEILQAASSAVGATRATGDHPNYIRFHFRGQPEFPNIDELFVLLQHGVLRRIQERCLRGQLRRTAATLLGSPRKSEEIAQVLSRFEQILESEKQMRQGWKRAAAAGQRHQHARLCGWTDCFIPHLLREFAAIDLLQEHGGPGTQLTSLRRIPYYYPVSQDPRWTCWASVVEIAIRRLVRAALEIPDSIADHQFVWSARSSVPAVLFAPPSRPPCALAIYFASFDVDTQLSRVLGLAAQHCSWQLTSSDALWPRPAPRSSTSDGDDAASGDPSKEDDSRLNWSRTVLRAPATDQVWAWAAKQGKIDPNEARRWLGLEDSPTWNDIQFETFPS